MNWKKERLKNFNLYAITDLKEEDPKILEKIEQAIKGGVDIIQLRSKHLSDEILVELGVEIRKIANRMEKLFIMNDRPDLALRIKADGVHLGQDDLPIEEARKIVGQDMIIGCSTHSLKQAEEASKRGADYIGFGPIYGTPTKPHYAPIGLKDVREVMKTVKIPVVCIGGIDHANAPDVLSAGAKRIAVVRAIFASSHPEKSAEQLKRLINGNKN